MNLTPAAASTTTSTAAPPSFDDDLAFLNAHGKTLVLTGPDGGKVALSALYQGRVMTSAVAASGRSLGWINRSFIEAGKTGTQFDNFGGEDRFWLGPEGGQFGLYFPAGKGFTFDAWQTPHAMQEGAWSVAETQADRVVFKKSMTVTNWSKTELAVDVERTARLLSRDDAKKVLGLAGVPGTDVGFVAYETRNRIVNAGKTPWTKDKGLVSIWILAMFAPAADARVVIPFDTAAKGEIVNDRYFGKVPADRLAVHDEKGFLSFKCDGKERGKIGLGPTRAKNVLGSYSAEAKLLTIVHYDGPKKSAPYVNSMWEEQKEPYKGDVVNSYNDGPPAPGKPPLGGFYEIETSSPAAELAPGKDMLHTHRTFHFVGEPAVLEPIAKKVLGVSLSEIGAPRTK
ncbi:MAG: hypothetical protein K0S65_3195 [Labilithrix sp.]|nr:hypothetical protein [Labilithrix sp.]